MQTYVCAPLMASINGLLCPHPPDAIRLTEAEYQRFNTLSGWDIDRRGNGRVAEWSWGERAVTAETIQWLRNVLNIDEPYAVAWIEPDESAYAFQAIMEGEEFEWSWFEGGLYRPFRLVFLETVPGHGYASGGVVGSGGAIVGSGASAGTVGAPVWTDAAPTSPAPIGAAYSYTFVATGAVAYSLVGGMLPPGLTLTAAGGLAGTPIAVGYWTFFVKAENASGYVVAACTVQVES